MKNEKNRPISAGVFGREIPGLPLQFNDSLVMLEQDDHGDFFLVGTKNEGGQHTVVDRMTTSMQEVIAYFINGVPMRRRLELRPDQLAELESLR